MEALEVSLGLRRVCLTLRASPLRNTWRALTYVAPHMDLVIFDKAKYFVILVHTSRIWACYLNLVSV